MGAIGLSNLRLSRRGSESRKSSDWQTRSFDRLFSRYPQAKGAIMTIHSSAIRGLAGIVLLGGMLYACGGTGDNTDSFTGPPSASATTIISDSASLRADGTSY